MKRGLRIGLYCAVFCLALSLASCYSPFYLPEEGRWYCEELNMTLDFSTHLAETEAEETTTELPYDIGYDHRIFVYEKTGQEPRNYILAGDFRCKDDIVTVKTSDGTVYTFLPTDD